MKPVFARTLRHPVINWIYALLLLATPFMPTPSARADSSVPRLETLIVSGDESWRYPAPAASSRIIVIGDIHGDLGALYRILSDRGLVDIRGHWIGGANQLVLLGDLNDRGNDTRYIIEYVRRLEREAQLQSGKVHTLMGNHDLMILRGDFRYTAPNELSAYEGFRAHRRLRITGPPQLTANGAPRRLSSLEADYWAALAMEHGRWMISSPCVIQIGPYVFSHGGIQRELFDFPGHVSSFNATVRAWALYLTAPYSNPRPPQSTLWVFTAHQANPTWDHKLALGKSDPKDVEFILRTLNATHIFVGDRKSVV